MNLQLGPHDEVLVSSDGDVRIVTLNRPDALNAADRNLHAAVERVWPTIASDASARAVVLTGAGRAFSAGGDMYLLDAMMRDETLRRDVLDEGARIVRNMCAIEIPIVAAVNGPAVGLGFSLATLADYVVIGENSFFADPHVAIGLVAGDGGVLTLPPIIGLLRAKAALFLGGRITATDALRSGLVNQVVPDGTVVDEAIAVATQLASLPPQAVRETKRLLNTELRQRVDDALDDALDAEYKSFATPEFQLALARILSSERA
jgi:enoyl-CoA hydratase